MQLQASTSVASFQYGKSPLALTEIFSESTSLSCWKRTPNRVIQAYFDSVSTSLRLGIRNVYEISSLKSNLDDLLPDGIGKEQAVNDIYLLADMLTCLFNCSGVGLRLTAVDKAMCPRFHVDNIPVRLITTYLGPGTQWLPNEYADASKLGHGSGGRVDDESGLYTCEQSIEQLSCFDVALLKGSAWGESHSAAIHRSCDLRQNKSRVLLTLDPI